MKKSSQNIKLTKLYIERKNKGITVPDITIPLNKGMQRIKYDLDKYLIDNNILIYKRINISYVNYNIQNWFNVGIIAFRDNIFRLEIPFRDITNSINYTIKHNSIEETLSYKDLCQLIKMGGNKVLHQSGVTYEYNNLILSEVEDVINGRLIYLDYHL